jgi:ArsR family transcriptional regulator, arsenate/arsenite/antimonite-responsive transcriptional repressor
MPMDQLGLGSPEWGGCSYFPSGEGMDADEAAAALAALGHRVRLDVWRLLRPHGSLGLPAGIIAARLAVPPSSLSFHLLQMARGRVLLQRRLSRQVIYAINDEVVDALFGLLSRDDALQGPPNGLPARQARDFNRQGERGPVGLGDDLAPTVDLGS